MTGGLTLQHVLKMNCPYAHILSSLHTLQNISTPFCSGAPLSLMAAQLSLFIMDLPHVPVFPPLPFVLPQRSSSPTAFSDDHDYGQQECKQIFVCSVRAQNYLQLEMNCDFFEGGCTGKCGAREASPHSKPMSNNQDGGNRCTLLLLVVPNCTAGAKRPQLLLPNSGRKKKDLLCCTEDNTRCYLDPCICTILSSPTGGHKGVYRRLPKIPTCDSNLSIFACCPSTSV